VYNGFDDSRLPPPAPPAEAGRRPFTVVMTGRMTAVKHYDLVIAAARLLGERAAGWRFLLIGDGDDRARLQEEALDLVGRGVVGFPDPGLEILHWVRDADVGVLMTNPVHAREGLSNSIMEYMALGLPVVCGDGGGNPELVKHGVTGLVIPPADPQALADSLLRLHDDPDGRRALGEAGRRRILTEFSVSTMVDRMLAVYAEAIELGGRGHRLRRLSRPRAC
jgi:glycosyltransferase involved in cell wall biosynthesis